MPEAVSLIATVLDEVGTVDALMESIAGQSRPPDEVIVVDGGSTDGTWQRLEAWQQRLPLRALREAGANIARGRNLAIAAATGEVVAVTDAGVRLDPEWLERLLARLEPTIDVVGGFFLADARTPFEVAMGATVLPDRSDVRDERFLPSSRSVLVRREAWASVGGYPEWLDYCEDLVFDLALQRAGRRFAFASDAIAWFRPRGSLGTFFRQYFLYARGDGKADLWRCRHAVRYATYLGVPFALWRLRGAPWAWIATTFAALAYVRRPYARLLQRCPALRPREAIAAALLVPAIRFTGDLAKMAGYPVGVAWRWRQGPRIRPC